MNKHFLLLTVIFIVYSYTTYTMDEQTKLLDHQQHSTDIEMGTIPTQKTSIQTTLQMQKNQNTMYENISLTQRSSQAKDLMSYLSIASFAAGWGLEIADCHTTGIIAGGIGLVFFFSALVVNGYQGSFLKDLKHSINKNYKLLQQLNYAHKTHK